MVTGNKEINFRKRDFHDKFLPYYKNQFSDCRVAGSGPGLLVADVSASRRKDCSGLWHRLVRAVRSTFNIDFPGLKVAQSWIWEPKADRVTYEGKDKAGNPVKITYVRSQLSNQPDNVKNEIDPSFNNNQYWLFLPFHACWDAGAKVEDSGMHKLPMGGGSARRVVMTYPPEGGGYTPGDTWEMYIGSNNLIQQLLWRRGPGKSIIVNIVDAKWLDYKKIGPLLLSLDHRGTGDGKPLRIFFTDVAVKLAGSDTWVNAQ